MLPSISKDRPHIEHGIYGSFVVTRTSLESWYRIVADFLQDSSAVRFSVVVPGKEPLVTGSIEEVMSNRNAKTSKVAIIFVGGESGDCAAVVTLDSIGLNACSSVHLSASGPEVDRVSSLLGRVEDEARDIAVWYGVFRKITDRTLNLGSKIPSWIYLVVSVLCAVVVVLILVSVVTFAVDVFTSKPAAPESVIVGGEQSGNPSTSDPEAVGFQAEANRKSTIIQISKYPVLISVGAVVGMFGPRAYGAMFPRVDFLIGDGIERHTRLRAFRGVILVTVLLSGILIPLIRSRWLGM